MALTRISTTATGTLTELAVDDVSVLLYPATELADGPAGLWLRRRNAGDIEAVSLIGQSAITMPMTDATGQVTRAGHWRNIDVSVVLRPSAEHATWFWHVRVRNIGPNPVEIDLLHTQDVALAPPSAVRSCEYYVSQYLDLTPVEVSGHGTALGIRQNMPGPRAPWALIGCLGRASGWGTDALQLTGRGRPEGAPWPGLVADLPSTRVQGEHTVAALQSAPLILVPGESADTGFFGLVLADHPERTSDADAAHAYTALRDPAALPPTPRPHPGPEPSGPEDDQGSLFGTAAAVGCRPLGDDELAALVGVERTFAESDEGTLLSFFTADGGQLVTAAKQARVLRPHGQILRSGESLTPDETALCATVWMDGTFCSQLTQGHVGFGTVLSGRHSYLGLAPAHGLRIFVRSDREGAGRRTDWRLLGSPSAWYVGADHCRWFYAFDASVVEVTTRLAATDDRVEVRVVVHEGPELDLLAALHVSWLDPDGPRPVAETTWSGARLRPPVGSETARLYPDGLVEIDWSSPATEVSDDAPLFLDGRSRDLCWLTLKARRSRRWTVGLTPRLVDRPQRVDRGADPGRPDDLRTRTGDAIQLATPRTDAGRELDRIGAILPWYVHDALVHYLSPRGLEQFTGGAWGTRDVSQGPVGLLLALGAHDELRDLVLLIMSAQNVRGDWPQAFEFVPRHARPGQGDSHGDVVYWPLAALADYLATTGDSSILAEPVPFAGDDGPTEPDSVLEHVGRALDNVATTLIAGTGLPAYGRGDWNDSLQPVDADLARRLVSTWTAVLQTHTLRSLADALPDGALPDDAPDGAGTGSITDRARRLAEDGLADLRRLLLVDGVLAGYGVFEDCGVFDGGTFDGGAVRPLIHPSDHETGLSLSLLPMIHAIAADQLTPAEAHDHLALIEKQLTGPDGARLFDRPAPYRGGPMELFQRAEASTFFGREIGLMYMHAQLRYAEALARVGDGPGLLRALGLANPIGITDRVPGARPRQSTCYFSSSDAAFPDRAAAAAGYDRIADGDVGFEGGWRIYSSGPGLFVQLVVQRLLGVRQRGADVEFDPVLDPDLDGLTVRLPLLGRQALLTYRVGERGHGVSEVRAAGAVLRTTELSNPYRAPGVLVDAGRLGTLLTDPECRLEIVTR